MGPGRFYHQRMAPQALAPQAAARELSAPSAGPATAVLTMVIVRVAIMVRLAAVGYVVVQVLIMHAFYLSHLWALWGPVAAMAWGCAAVTYLHHRQPTWPLVCLDTAVYVALAAGAGWCVPAGIRGEAASWLFIVMASQFPVLIWFAPKWLSVTGAIITGTAFLTGAVLSHPAHAPRGVQPGAVAVLFAVVVGIHWTGRSMLNRRAARADTALAAADLDARDQYVILSRNIERREHDRLLHDTMLNTLTAIARSGDAEAVRSACRHSIGMLERALSEPVEPASGQFSGDPAGAIGQVAGEMRARGLNVHLEVFDGDEPGAAGVTGEAGDRFPATVARALAHGTREALMNVTEHAGTGEAWVTVRMTAPQEGAHGSVQVRIRDEGAGFDIDRVDLVRLGVRRSIIERVTDVGGSASVDSAPGSGTVVALDWPGMERPADDRLAPERPGSESFGAGPLAFQTAGNGAGREQDQW
jgi:signal transduction histidine kinase